MRLSKTQQFSSVKVNVFWGDVLYDTLICYPGEELTVGTKSGSHFLLNIPGVEKPMFPLVKMVSAQELQLLFNDTMDGHIRSSNQFKPLNRIKLEKNLVPEGGLYKLSLSRPEKADIVIGDLSFYIDWVETTNLISRKNPDRNKRVFQTSAIITGVMAFVLLFVNYFPVTPPVPPERLVQIITEDPPPPKPIPKEPRAKAAAGEKKSADGGSAKGEAGTANLVVKANPQAKPAAGSATNGLEGLVGNLTSIGTRGTGGAKNAKDVPNAIASNIDKKGNGGFSADGLKSGGGGSSIGIGRTIGQGEGGFGGSGQLGLSGNSKIEAGSGYGKIEAETDTASGLDRQVIDNIIRRRQDRIRLCYEKQLTYAPQLAGKITVSFTIGKGGKVVKSSILEDTMKDPTVKSCLLAEVADWTFPEPNGGSEVKVDYPFVFESGSRGTASK